jgi:hypothetical protein
MLYHKDLGLPQVQYPSGTRSLSYTGHAKAEASQDKLGDISEYLPDSIDLSQASIVEVETNESGSLVKMVLRTDYDDETDLVSVVTDLHRNTWTVKTVWLTLKADNHRTLDRKRYAFTYQGQKVA